MLNITNLQKALRHIINNDNMNNNTFIVCIVTKITFFVNKYLLQTKKPGIKRFRAFFYKNVYMPATPNSI